MRAGSAVPGCFLRELHARGESEFGVLADVEGATRLWQTQPEEMTAAIAGLDRTVCEVISDHHGVRPVEQGEGDSFVVAYTRASNAVACALELQRAPLAPIRLRIGVHTGEVQMRDEGNYVGPTINRTARLRDLAHDGQTVLSGTTEDLVLDRLPADAWLTDLGTHQLRDLPRLERVVQLCHPDPSQRVPAAAHTRTRCRPASSGAVSRVSWAAKPKVRTCGRSSRLGRAGHGRSPPSTRSSSWARWAPRCRRWWCGPRRPAARR
jgi:class 3 adenylate cyclase